MKMKLWLKELDMKMIISRHSHPLLLFICTALILFLGVQMHPFCPQGVYLLFFVGIFTFIFSVLHWLVWMVLEVPKQRVYHRRNIPRHHVRKHR